MKRPESKRPDSVIDFVTSRVLRLTAYADDIPKDIKVIASSMEVDYDEAPVAGRTYLLPARSLSHMERDERRIDNVVTFTGYRKFETESTVDFGK